MLPVTAALILALAPLVEDPQLPNGDFGDWDDGQPTGWTISNGATSPGDRDSEIAPGPEGGILLRGGAATGRWKTVSREVALEPGACYRLSFEARASGLVREGKQFDNAHVGVQLPVEGGRPEFRVISIEDRAWTPDEAIFRAPASGKAVATLFLSKTGTLEARGFALERLRPEDSFEILVRHMGRYYSHFASKGIDPAAWAEKHRAKAAAAKDLSEWCAAVKPMLAELEDVHVAMLDPIAKHMVYVAKPRGFRNFDVAAARRWITEPRQFGPIALAGTVGGGYGYLAVFRMPTRAADFVPVLDALDGMLDRKGIVLDLRADAGGDENRGLELASRFAREAVVYARTRVRSGPKPTDLSAPRPRTLSPRSGRRFEGPVVVLIGPGCISSGEGLAQMMAAIEGVTLLGQRTAGCSGNPQPVDLPNGSGAIFSRWLDELPDGTPLEGRGVPPDREVRQGAEGDAALEEAIRVLDAANGGEKR